MRVGRRLKGGFTLVELLVVVSILLLVAVIALPSITSLSKSAARRAAVSQSMGMLDQARTVALSQGNTVYVVFADGNTVIPADYRFRSYAMFREVYYPERHDYAPNGSGPAQPYQMEMIRPWTKLPDGVAFKKSTEKTVFDGPTASFHVQLSDQQGNRVDTDLKLPYLRFNSMGNLEQKTGEPWDTSLAELRIFEGFINDAGVPVATNKPTTKSSDSAGDSVDTADEVIGLSTITGRARRETKDAG